MKLASTTGRAARRPGVVFGREHRTDFTTANSSLLWLKPIAAAARFNLGLVAAEKRRFFLWVLQHRPAQYGPGGCHLALARQHVKGTQAGS